MEVQGAFVVIGLWRLAVQRSSAGRFFICVKPCQLLGSGELCKLFASHGASPPGICSLAPLASFPCIYYTTNCVIRQYVFRNFSKYFYALRIDY